MSRKKNKILIIKLGYSETLIPEIRRTCSLGDVLRTTIILHLFKNDHVTWLTDEAAMPLLRGNPYIHKLLPFDLLSVLQLEHERFDKVINLEKVPGICALVNRISAWSHYGFRFDEETGAAKSFEKAHEALQVATRKHIKSLKGRSWAQLIYGMLGSEWRGESYILGYKPRSKVTHDLGFNVHVGQLIPIKAWPASNWRELERLAAKNYSISHQQHLNNLEGYMDWINSCRMIVTNDSLGLFLGLSLGKKVLALFGPTEASEIAPHQNLRTLEPTERLRCRPCFRTVCQQRKQSCVGLITPRRVYEAIEDWGVNELC